MLITLQLEMEETFSQLEIVKVFQRINATHLDAHGANLVLLLMLAKNHQMPPSFHLLFSHATTFQLQMLRLLHVRVNLKIPATPIPLAVGANPVLLLMLARVSRMPRNYHQLSSSATTSHF